MDEQYDVVVIGGGAAGLSGAVALARSRRSVLVLDAGDPRNAAAGHVHNFLTRDGAAPAELYAAGRAEVIGYGGRVEPSRVRAVRQADGHFAIELEERTVTARRVLVATGGRDELPDIPGLAERWGLDVLHCPYCHGWEVRDRRIGVLCTTPLSGHQAQLFRQLSPRVLVLQHTGPLLADEQREQFEVLGIEVVEGEVVGVDSGPNGLTGVRLVNGETVALEALVVAPTLWARAELLEPLGLRPTEVAVQGHVIGTVIEADPLGLTAVPGVWVAGNLANIQAQVVSSAAAGLAAGAAINADLIAEDTAQALHQHHYHHIYGQQAWEERYRSRGQNWSGQPNAALVAEVSGLAPGTALDAGSGEGGDAIWLASQGWTVTGAEFSATALERSSAAAEAQGVEVTWQHLDLVEEAPTGTYDLVSSFFLHLPLAQRRIVFTRLAAAVAPGGTLLVVGHDLADLHSAVGRPQLREMGWTTDEIVELLGEGWRIVVAEARPRTVVHEGNEVAIHDAVVRAVREV